MGKNISHRLSFQFPKDFLQIIEMYKSEPNRLVSGVFKELFDNEWISNVLYGKD